MSEDNTPAPGTKAAVEAERDRLAAEVQRLQGELTEARAGAPAGAASPARVTFAGRPAFGLSEGERQDLEINGVAADPHGGGQILASDHGVEVKTEGGRERLANAEKAREPRKGIEGVDYVYPSVAPGVLAEDAPVRGAVQATPPTEA